MPFSPIIFPSLFAKRKEDPKPTSKLHSSLVDFDDTTILQGVKFSNQFIQDYPEVVEWVLKSLQGVNNLKMRIWKRI